MDRWISGPDRRGPGGNLPLLRSRSGYGAGPLRGRAVGFGFGNQKINLHQHGAEISPHGRVPTPGSADLCFLTPVPITEVIAHLERIGVAIELGPVPCTGATGPIASVYLRDPDGNLLEIANQRADWFVTQ